jgi:hypothetical protein
MPKPSRPFVRRLHKMIFSEPREATRNSTGLHTWENAPRVCTAAVELHTRTHTARAGAAGGESWGSAAGESGAKAV